MAKCKKCGRDTWSGRRICHSCMKKWTENREKAFNQAISEIGPLTAKTHEAIKKRVKQLEKSFKKPKKNF